MTSRRSPRLVLALLVMTACQQPDATPAALTEEDQNAIREVFATVVRTLRAGDFDAFVATFADDAVFHPANAAALHGRDAIKAWITAGPKASAAFDFTDVEVHGEGNFAYATSAINMALEGVPPDVGKQLVVLRKTSAGKWETVAVSFNSDTPMPGAPPPTTTTGQ